MIKVYKIFMILLFFIGCGNNNEKISNNINFWEVKYFINQFRELTDVGYVTNTNLIKGKYSNSKSSDAPLNIKIMIKERDVGIKLYEGYDERLVIGNKQNPIEYSLNIKHNDENVDFNFKGFNENNVIVIGNIISSTHQTLLIDYFKKGGKLEFILETKNIINKTIYQFQIDSEDDNEFLKKYKKIIN